MRSKRIGLLALLAAGLFAARNAQATFTIDNFSQLGTGYTSPISLSAPGIVTTTGTGITPTNTIGGSRQATLTFQSGVDPAVDNITFAISTLLGQASYSSTDNADGELQLLYNANGAGLGVDFTTEAAVNITFIAFDFANSAPLPVDLTISDGSTSFTTTQSLTTGGAQVMSFPLAPYVVAGVNLATVQSLTFDFKAAKGHDFTFTLLDTTPVPEPATLLSGFLGVALWGGLVARRLQKRLAA